MPTSPIMTVGSPIKIGLAGPRHNPGISMTMSPMRQAIMLLMKTVGLPSMTIPTPSGPRDVDHGAGVLVHHGAPGGKATDKNIDTSRAGREGHAVSRDVGDASSWRHSYTL